MEPTKVYLAQTDTTVGFLSQDSEKLAQIKKRPPSKPFLIAVSSLKNLQKFVRVPKKHKNLVRRAKKTTFIYPNGKALRVINSGEHYKFLQKFCWFYSTSANESGKRFEREWAIKRADIVVEDWRGLYESEPSKIFKLSKKRVVKVR
ncbi:Sua5/YciO/YrdC/YwlC family protein [Nitratiruptor tergarcus]|uniref:tRNA A37 threonylcarbamoyladenosine synthetase subunit TsaC/SUA5/YrdC n=1 Tax=Nitratiruptor tergarcus DSM 16512 TaxID=1069081 RepID=A0A1W1WSE2_9BACT|nr:Sua5/YciO/YrdC/YwlC family protein [Nitratiruptor tergarcus]SMC09224.1 tRNA A37 threonylcarbamoyladenosine synthetase subunit TsaC/SUA5/YrdC [Nitratiruptor tergarcus DSM 16512]